jgi:hypothetical protein
MLFSPLVILQSTVTAEGTPSIFFSYDTNQNTLIISDTPDNFYYSSSNSQSGANLIFKWSFQTMNPEDEYVLANLSLGSTGDLSTKEIRVGDTLTGFVQGNYNVVWGPTGVTIGTFTVTNSQENYPLMISLWGDQLDPGVAENTPFSFVIFQYNRNLGYYTSSENATVLFNGHTSMTMSQANCSWSVNGGVTLVAPPVQTTQKLSITVNKEGCQGTTRYVTIRHVDHPAYGTIYGHVFLRNATSDMLIPADHALVVIGQNEHTPPVYLFTDVQGEYSCPVANVTTYRISASYKTNYTTMVDIFVGEDTRKGVNFTFTEQESQKSFSSNFVTMHMQVEKGIGLGIIGAVISIVTPSNLLQNQVREYNGVEINQVEAFKNKITVIVTGNETGGGRTIAIAINKSMFDSEGNLQITYDGEQIVMADNITDVMNPNDDGLHAEYLITIGADGFECLISIPHFSVHTIIISAIVQIVGEFSGVIAIALFIVVFCVLGVVYFIPFFLVKKRK